MGLVSRHALLGLSDRGAVRMHTPFASLGGRVRGAGVSVGGASDGGATVSTGGSVVGADVGATVGTDVGSVGGRRNLSQRGKGK